MSDTEAADAEGQLSYELSYELASIEAEVSVISALPTTEADGARLLELAAREYEILKSLSRPRRRDVEG